MNVHMGEMVKDVFEHVRQMHAKKTVVWLANQLHCDRRNIYEIFSRPTIDSQLLMNISLVLEHNFFEDIARIIKEEQERRSASPARSRLPRFVSSRISIGSEVRDSNEAQSLDMSEYMTLAAIYEVLKSTSNDKS
ncbi:MAG: hypothetical protein NC217_04590 [Muribaculaceae bacterium]|nr:hypothetical protein [Muribaculaceae bacterium]